MARVETGKIRAAGKGEGRRRGGEGWIEEKGEEEREKKEEAEEGEMRERKEEVSRGKGREESESRKENRVQKGEG